MSLSDKNTPNTVPDDGFKPMDLGALESFEKEVSVKSPETEPDYDRFKLLFDPEEEEKEEEVSFEALYKVTREIKQELFEPLIEGTDTEENGAPDTTPDPESDSSEGRDAPPEKTPEELGFEQGYQDGLARGQEEGRAAGETKGFEEGFAKGEAQGREKGEADGFAKGQEEGFQQGLEEGLEAGRTEVRAQTEDVLGPLKESLETADGLLDRMLVRYEGQLIELVYKIAEKAVAAKVDTDDEIVRHTIIDAMKGLVAPEEITLNVSTEDYEYVEMVKEVFFESIRSLNHVAVNSDPMIPKGGCRIESAGAVIATDPESKLAAVYDAVVGASRS
ncbi:MAG: flagellar biosynthesis/type III secretory pathway protein [Desulfobacter sp.]|nr:MAG: flagellar biosynthesis/type III secretory pathway protein [Desulfobacter sp.]